MPRPLHSRPPRQASARRPHRAAVRVAACIAFLALAFASGAQAQLDPVVASVNGRLITERDIDRYLLEMRLEQPALWRAPNELLYRRLADDLIEQELLYEYYWTDGVEEFGEPEARKAAQDAWTEFARLAGSDWRLKALMEESELGEADFRRWLVRRASREWLIRSGLQSDVDPALFNRADDNPANAVRVLLSAIKFRPSAASASRPGPEAKLEARKRATRVQLELIEGLPFDRAAELYNEASGEGRKTGSLGWLEVQALSDEVSEAVLSLTPGGFTTPLEMGDSLLILRLDAYETPAQQERREAMREARERALARIRPRSEVVLSEPYAEAGPEDPERLPPPDAWSRILQQDAPPQP